MHADQIDIPAAVVAGLVADQFPQWRTRPVRPIPSTGTVTVAVADNGIGVPDAHRRAIFDIFTRVDPGPGRGQGIGLATCHRIVGRHGGRIWAESQPGNGATFHFVLPRQDSAATPGSFSA